MIAFVWPVALFAWMLGICVHLLWEAWIIATRGFDALPECRRWWCPHGFLNNVKRGR